MQVKAGVSGQPLHDGRMLVGAVIVADQMKLATAIEAGERIEEVDELVVPVAPVAAAVNLPLATYSAANRLVVPLRV